MTKTLKSNDCVTSMLSHFLRLHYVGHHNPHNIHTIIVYYDGLIIASTFTLIYVTLLKTHFINYMKMFINKYVSKNIITNILTNLMFNIMYMKMFLKLTLISKAFLTNITRVWTFSSMHTQMYI